jgi:diacylglycerol O-acyltransferase / trehalose O-mycolyltransferase / mycolyltransferase Ag85
VLRLALPCLFLCASTSMPTSAQAACDPPRCLDVIVPVPSSLKVPDSTVRILIPAGYDESSERYPVLYLLHGGGDTYATWTENTDVQSFSADFPIIIVMPDGGHDANAGFYSDWLDDSRQWETFHTRVLRRFVDRSFRTLASRGHRAVMGLSMGGFGAMSYAARHRDLFAAAASFSGSVDTFYPTPAGNILFASGIVGRGVWGDPVTYEANWRRHNPTDLARDLRGIALFVATGDGTKGGPAGDVDNPGAYAIEEIVAAMNDSFAAALDRARVPYEKDFYPGGYHGWPYWERELHWSLPQIMALIGPGADGADERRCARRVARIGSNTGAKRAIRDARCP